MSLTTRKATDDAETRTAMYASGELLQLGNGVLFACALGMAKAAGTAITAVLEWASINEFRAEGSRLETVRWSLPKRAVHAGWPELIHRLRPVTQAATLAI